MVQILSVDGTVRWRHEPVSDSDTGQVDLDFGCWILVVNLLGDRRNKLSGVGFSEWIERITLILREELVKLDETFVQLTTHIILVLEGYVCEVCIWLWSASICEVYEYFL